MGSSLRRTVTRLKPPVIAGIVVVGVWFLLLRPVSLGGPTSFEVVSGTSM